MTKKTKKILFGSLFIISLLIVAVIFKSGVRYSFFKGAVKGQSTQNQQNSDQSQGASQSENQNQLGAGMNGNQAAGGTDTNYNMPPNNSGPANSDAQPEPGKVLSAHTSKSPQQNNTSGSASNNVSNQSGNSANQSGSSSSNTPGSVNPTPSSPPALLISSIHINPSINQTDFTWQTNLPTSSKIFITQGTNTNTFVSVSGVSTNHSTTAANLAAGTEYSYLIDATTADGQDMKSSGVFETLPSPKQPYVFAKLGFSISATKDTIIAVLNDPTIINPTLTLTITNLNGQAYPATAYQNPAGNYIWETGGLSPNTTYNYSFTVEDSNHIGTTNGTVKTTAAGM